MKDILKRWNQLAGTEKTIKENREQKTTTQDLYGNQFILDLLKEDLGDALADEKEESGGEEESDKEAPEEGEEEEEEGEIGDEEKATLSNADLMKGLKQGAKAIAEEIPPPLNDEFADVMNSVKDMASDKPKLMKLIRFIEKIK